MRGGSELSDEFGAPGNLNLGFAHCSLGRGGDGANMWRRPEESNALCSIDKAALLRAALSMARPGLEPGTPAFSMPCSTN